MSSTTTTYHQVSRVEFDYHPDPTDPCFSFLTLHIYSPNSSTIRAHQIHLFATDPTSADHLHNIYLLTQALPALAERREEEPI